LNKQEIFRYASDYCLRPIILDLFDLYGARFSRELPTPGNMCSFCMGVAESAANANPVNKCVPRNLRSKGIGVARDKTMFPNTIGVRWKICCGLNVRMIDENQRTLEQVYRRAVAGLYGRLRSNYEYLYQRFGKDGLRLIEEMSREYGLSVRASHLRSQPKAIDPPVPRLGILANCTP